MMLAQQKYYFIALAVFLLLFSASFLLFRQDGPVLYENASKVPYRPYRSYQPSLRDTVKGLFETIKHDPQDPNYRDAQGKEYVANQTIWRKGLGKKVLIVDIDTRVPTDKNQILNPATIDYENLEMTGGGLVSNAIINHYLYALIHGYDYKFYQAEHIPEHHDTWIMPHVFRELIDDYQFVVAMDADVTVSHLEVPLEWMFNRWGIQKHTSMALPWDTEEWRDGICVSRDSKDLRVLNTGFVVAQNSKTTKEMLEAWRDCTTEKRYPGCAHWKTWWSHEQRAFSEYIRYDFNNTPDTIVSIDCDDAVGWPGFKADVEAGNAGISDCNGNFVRHYTLGKHQVKAAGSTGVMQAISDALQKNLLKEQDHVWVREGERRKAASVVKNEDDQSETKKDEAKEDSVPLILEGTFPGTGRTA